MKYVKGGKAPSGQPEEDIVPSGEHPQYRQICVGDDTSTICYIPPVLLGTCVTSFVVRLPWLEHSCDIYG